MEDTLARFKPQIAPSLVERITQEIKSSIVAGDLHPGEQFSIGELAAEMDVSHIPVREALRRLEGDGLIQLRQGRRAIVTPMSVEELDEVYRLRVDIEVDLVGRSARHYTDEQLEAAARACESLGVAGPDGRNLRDVEAHHQLHLILLSPAAGPHALRITERLMDVADRYVRLVYDARPVAFDEPYRRHRLLVEAAETRRAPAMRKALTAHLTENLEYMKAWLAPQLETAEEEFATAASLES